MNQSRPKPKPKTITRSISLPQDLAGAISRRAEAEERSFSWMVCRALKRDLVAEAVKATESAGK